MPEQRVTVASWVTAESGAGIDLPVAQLTPPL